jgi:hypothetical protein
MKKVFILKTSLVSLLMVGCMQAGGRGRVTESSHQNKAPSYREYLDPSNWNSGGSPTTVTPTPSPTPGDSNPTVGRSELPPMQFAVQAIGYSSTESFSVEVRARKILRVRFAPGVQLHQVQGTGFSPLYSGLGVFISVGSATRATPLLDNGVYSGRPEQSAIMDFSAQIPNTCAASDSQCRASVRIVISRPNYNYYCLNGMGGCPWDRVHPNHPWNGTLWVETDDTQPLK